ncbi:MAG: ABC transporter substrate-binding protein [Candidatus Rokuibacteriota bacterium]
MDRRILEFIGMRKLVAVWMFGLLFFSPYSEAQGQSKVWRIGAFHVGLDHVPPSLPTLREGLKALGYEEGKNLRLDWRNLADEEAARETAKEFVRSRVDLIVAFEAQTVRAAKAATSEIPIVFLHVADPVADGFVKSMSHPGGNLTGFVTWPISPAKQMELFKEIVPGLRRVLILFDPQDPATPRFLAELRRAGAALKLQLVEREVTSQANMERLFSSVKRGEVEGIFGLAPTLQTKFPSLILRLSSEKRLPLASNRKEWVEQGALFSYAADLAPVGRAAAPYVDKILKGTKPADLPVEEPTRFELVINLKVAKALGLTIPSAVLNRADKVIQ